MCKFSWKKLVSLFASVAVLLSLVGCSVEMSDGGSIATEVTTTAATTTATETTTEPSEDEVIDETEEVVIDESADESIDESTDETVPEESDEDELITDDSSISDENVIIEETEATESFYDDTEAQELLDIDGVYTSKDDVALYIYQYGELPSNFMTKKDAKALGWTGGSLEPYAPGMCIGGDYFGNYEGILPEKKGRDYHECDINTLGAKSRGAERIIFSSDGLIYYTEDHYESFTLLYGEE